MEASVNKGKYPLPLY